MRILMVTPMPPQTQPSNGVPLVTYAQLLGLGQRQHQVTLATIAGPAPDEHNALEQLRRQGVNVHAVLRHAGQRRLHTALRLARSAVAGREPLRSSWYYDERMQHLLTTLLREQDFDIVQLDDNATGMYQLPAHVPCVLTEHEVRRPRPFRWREIRYGWQALWAEEQWRRWQGYQRRVWQRASRVVVFTQRDADAIATIAPDIAPRTRVNPFGLALPEAANPACEEAATLLFVGGYSHAPNCDAALWLAREIMPALRKIRPTVELLLVGDAPPPELRAFASADISITGRVPVIEPLIERATVVLSPVRIGGGMRTKVLQAMAMGKAVVSTSLGAEGLKLDNIAAPLVVADTAEAFAQAIDQLLANSEQRHLLGKQARAFVQEHFSPEAYAQRMEAIYNDVIAEHRNTKAES